MRQQLKKILLLLLLFFPLTGFSLQLGKIIVLSSQGQPLSAEIELMLTSGEDISKLQTSLASKENYEAQGIERLNIHNNISAEMQKNEKGLTVLKLKSTQPVPDPFLDLLIQVDSPKGRNYREYTVLLDPPETPIVLQEKIVAVDKTELTQNNDKKEVKENSDKSKVIFEKESKYNSKSSDKNKPSEASPKTTLVKPSDTVYKIARENKIPGISTEQMVIGIFNLNELAFTNKNINGLEVGQKISVPTKDDFVNLSHSKAMAEIKIQASQWNRFASKTAEAVAVSPKSNNTATTETALETIVTPNDIKSPPPRIKLSGDTLNGDKSNKEIIQKEINQISDDKTALEKNIKDAELKIALLEKELADARKILNVSNQALFDLQEKAKQINQTKELSNKSATVEAKPDLNSLINKNNDSVTPKNETISTADSTFKSSISDGSIDEKGNAQLAADKDPVSSPSHNELVIFLGVLFAILSTLFVIKNKKQKEKKDFMSSIKEDNSNHSNSSTNQAEVPSAGESATEDIGFSGIEINLSDSEKKPPHLD